MATIQTSIRMHDGMTPAFKNVNKALNSVNSAFQKLQNLSSKGFNANAIKSITTDLGRVQNYLGKTQSTLEGVRQKTLANRNAQNQHNQSLRAGSSAASSLWNKLKGVFTLYMGMQAAGAIIKTADELTMTTARLNLMTGSLEETKKVQDQIYESAMRSRAGYLQTADAVAKLRLRAGQIFTTNDEAIAFSETLNKMFAIAGASQSEMYSATLQLTQALGSGVLRGEEFRAVFEAAPNVMQAVADYMNLPIGKLREIANEGAISADIVKKAMFKAAEQVDEQFKEIPYTWRQVWTLVKNFTIKATEPILERIRNITKSERFIKFADMVGVAIQNTADFLVVAFDAIQKGVANCFDFIVEHAGTIQTVFSTLKTVISEVYTWFVKIFDFVNNNWSLMAPIIWGVVAAMTALKIQTMWAAIASIGHAIASAWETLCITALYIQSHGLIGALKLLALAQGLCASTALIWVFVIIAVIAVFYLLIAIINKVCDTSISATGIIFAVFAWLVGALWDMFLSLVVVALHVVDAIANAFITLCEIVYNGCVNGFTGWISGVKAVWYSFVQWIYDLIRPLVELWDKFKGTNYAATIQAGIDADLASTTKTGKYKKFERSNLASEAASLYVNPNKWGSSAYNYGANLFSGSDKKNSLDKLQQSLIPKDLGYTPIPTDLGYTPIPTDATKSPHATDIGKALSDGFDTANPLLDKIAGNTGDISSSLNSTDEDLSYMRDLAEREAINRYTLTDLKVEQNNNNNFANGVDADSMLNLLKKILHEGVQSTANGVHI